jgi:hypothetical protein
MYFFSYVVTTLLLYLIPCTVHLPALALSPVHTREHQTMAPGTAAGLQRPGRCGPGSTQRPGTQTCSQHQQKWAGKMVRQGAAFTVWRGLRQQPNGPRLQTADASCSFDVLLCHTTDTTRCRQHDQSRCGGLCCGPGGYNTTLTVAAGVCGSSPQGPASAQP